MIVVELVMVSMWSLLVDVVISGKFFVGLMDSGLVSLVFMLVV